jgi:hypothetical protein
MNITARLLQSQILEVTSGKRFDLWLLSELDGVKVLFYQYITAYTPNSVGYSFSLTPMSSYTTEELALGFLLVYNPAALGLSTTQAESIITEMRLLVLDMKPATERKTVIANKLAAMQQAQKEIEAGTYQQPNDTTLKDPAPSGTGKGVFSLSESLKGALNSPIFWGIVLLVAYRIWKNRKSKSNEQ